MLTLVFILCRKTTIQHRYNTRANKQRIMFEYEQENAATREALAQLQGQMDTILEHLQAQGDNVTIVNMTGATVVTTTTDTALVMVEPVDIGVQPVTVSQPLFQADPSRLVVAYPWGLPHNYTL